MVTNRDIQTEMIDKPRLLEDGAHLIPIWKIQCADCECHPDATGIVKWHPEEGVTFTVEFPNCSSTLLGRFYRIPSGRAEIGRIAEHPTIPRWIATTSDGRSVQLYGSDEKVQSQTSSDGFRCKVAGNAWFVAVEFGNESPLSFWNSTPEISRVFFLGFGSYYWSKAEDISFQNATGETSTIRRSVLLIHSAKVEIYEAGFRVNLLDGGWLTCDAEERTDGLVSDRCASYCSFISFLNGRMTPIFWQDSFTDSSTLKRVYFGTNRVRLASLISTLPLLPLRSSTEPHTAQMVVEQLPALFAAWLQWNKSLDLVFILAPLWSACDSLLTDRLSLACVSLERLAAVWKKSPGGRAAGRKRKFWTPLQSCKIRKALENTVDALASETKLDEVQITVLKKRFNNLGQCTNEDRLTAIFDDLHLELNELEKKVIAQRNDALHGKTTLRDLSSLPEIDTEVLRSDTLRMMITKAVLALLQYRGPYINYAARSPQTDFPIECLKINPANSGSGAGEIQPA